MPHELGHGVYDKYLSPDLPFLLRHPAHTNSTEGIAMLMGRLTHNRDWLQLVAGAPRARADELGSAAELDLQFQMLTFIRWALVMTNFEKALYENPRRSDLNRLWWVLVHRYQLLEIPEGRADGAGPPDWAAKIHIALYPVYYHNYVLGELTASQIQHRLTEADGGRRWFDKPSSGAFLRHELFDLGATYPWNVTIERVTGEQLKPDCFVEQFVRPAA
jgi:peptidyl-dipeptidase A